MDLHVKDAIDPSSSIFFRFVLEVWFDFHLRLDPALVLFASLLLRVFEILRETLPALESNHTRLSYMLW